MLFNTWKNKIKKEIDRKSKFKTRVPLGKPTGDMPNIKLDTIYLNPITI